MIDIPLVSLVMIYLAVVTVLVGLFWWLASRSQRAEWKEQERARVACRACGHVFIDRSRKELAHCPHCGQPNERSKP